jgi:hypothetical protein
MSKSENRCANCGGKFGLVCHYHWGMRFCRKDLVEVDVGRGKHSLDVYTCDLLQRQGPVRLQHQGLFDSSPQEIRW